MSVINEISMIEITNRKMIQVNVAIVYKLEFNENNQTLKEACIQLTKSILLSLNKVNTRSIVLFVLFAKYKEYYFHATDDLKNMLIGRPSNRMRYAEGLIKRKQ